MKETEEEILTIEDQEAITLGEFKKAGWKINDTEIL